MVAIFVLSLFLFVLSVDLIVLRIQGKNHPAFEPSIIQYEISMYGWNKLTIPPDIFFSKGHTWLKKNGDGLIEVGIDAFAATALGTISILKSAQLGDRLKRGGLIFEGSYGNNVIKFLSPVDGIVKSINSDIMGKNISNPYESWGVRLVSNDQLENRDMFFNGNEALKWMKNEFVKLKRFIETHSHKIELAGETMYDGGSLSNNADSWLVDRSINDFEKEFFSL